MAQAEETADNITVGVDGLDGTVENGPSPSRASAISGTTARTTFSQEEIIELDSELMLDSFKDLAQKSDDLLKTIMSPAAAGNESLFAALDEMATEGTKAYKLYQKRLSAFAFYKSDYVTAGQEYIRPQNVCRAIFEVSSVDEIPQPVRRPDSVLYKANLANMLHELLVKMRDSKLANYDKTYVLDALNPTFPTVVSGEHFSHSAFALSIAISTQLAISRIESFIQDPNYSPQGIAEHTFFSDAEDGTLAYRHHNSLHLDELNAEQFKACMERITGIVGALKVPLDEARGLDPVEAVESLRASWPWARFIETSLIPYYTGRLTELDVEIRTAGGIDKLDSDVKLAAQNKDDLRSLVAMTQQLENARQSGKQKKRKSTAMSAAELKAIANTATPSGKAPVAQMTAPPAGSAYVQDPQLGGPFNAPPPANRSFNERQDGAQRIEWDESQAGTQPGHAPIPQSSVLGKRPRDTDEEQFNPTPDGGLQQDDDDDDAFESRDVDDAAAEARRNAAPTSFQSARPFLSQAPQFQQASPSVGRSPKRRNPGSTVPNQAEYPGSAYPGEYPSPNPNPNTAPASTARAQEYQQAAWTAKQYRILNNSTPARERRVWTDIETEALMTYIAEWPEEDNLHYAAMKRRDDTDEGLKALASRTAEDIRFRARNMKVNFLLGRSQDMHENWSKVQLGKKEIDKLHARGVPYNQVGLRGAQNANAAPGFEERNE